MLSKKLVAIPAIALTAGISLAAWVCYHAAGRDRGMCTDCREHPATTVWAGNGRMLCRWCCETRQDTYAEDQSQRLTGGHAS